MFGFLKKKLKEGIEKISRVVSDKEEEKIEQAVEEVRKEEQIQQPNSELVQQVEKAIEEEAAEVKEASEEKIPQEAKKEEILEHPKEELLQQVIVEEEKPVEVAVSEEKIEAVEKITEHPVEEVLGDIETVEEKIESIEHPSETKLIDEPVIEAEINEEIAEIVDEIPAEVEAEKPAEKVIAEKTIDEHVIEEEINEEVAEIFDEVPIFAEAEVPIETPKLEAKTEDKVVEEVTQLVEERIEENVPETPQIIPEKIEAEIKIEKAAEDKIEEAKQIIETARELEHVREEKPTEEAIETFDKKIEKVELPEVIHEEKKKLFGFLRRKPKKEAPHIIPEKIESEIKIEKVEEKPTDDQGIIEKIRKKITEKKIEEEDIRDILLEIETGLISSDVALEAAEKIIGDLRGNLVGKFIKKGEIEKVIKESMKNSIIEILNVQGFDFIEMAKTKKPFVVIFLGFNGVGKTTSIARIGYLLKNNGMSCVFAAADSWRAAAIEQLEEHGRNLDIPVIKHKYGADPAAVIYDAVKHAKSKGIDVVLADTAGRSHSNANLMDELKKIIKVNSPDLKILVLDALTGNDIYDQCKLFNDAVSVDGMILTKADVYEKGGAALAAAHTVKKPILYMGIGQNYEDLEKFDSKKIADRLID
jgi:fused signal recognition particle receptor